MNLLLEKGMSQLRAENYQAAIDIFRSNHDTRYAYLTGIAQYKAGMLDESLKTFAELYHTDPSNIDLVYNYGVISLTIGSDSMALSCFKRVVELDPENLDGHYNLAYVGIKLDKKAALKSLNYLLKLTVDRHNIQYMKHAHYMRAQLLLESNKFADGFKDLFLSQKSAHDKNSGNILLVQGDDHVEYIQLIRYAMLIAEKGTKVFCSLPNSLVGLFKPLESKTFKVLKKNERPSGLADSDVIETVNINMLPHLFNPKLNKLPKFTPYIPTPAKNSVNPGCLFKESEKLQVGIFWNNTLLLNDFSELLELDWVEWTLLPLKLDDEEQQLLRELGSKYNHTGKAVKKFTDMAAVISQLDLVISVNNVIAHIAGAMGKDVWLLLEEQTNWHWSSSASTSKWYPSVSIFRKRAKESWTSTIFDMQKKLYKV